MWQHFVVAPRSSCYFRSCYYKIVTKVCIDVINSSVIRQNRESQNGCFRKTKRQIFRKTNIFYPLYIQKNPSRWLLEKTAAFIFKIEALKSTMMEVFFREIVDSQSIFFKICSSVNVSRECWNFPLGQVFLRAAVNGCLWKCGSSYFVIFSLWTSVSENCVLRGFCFNKSTEKKSCKQNVLIDFQHKSYFSEKIMYSL